MLFRRKKWALQIDRIFNGVSLEPIYEVGKPLKISQLIKDMEENPIHFAKQLEMAEELDSTPESALMTGNLGFVPETETPIKALAIYRWNSPARRRTPYRGIKIVGYTLVLCVVAYVLLTAFVARRMEDGVRVLEQMDDHCIVTTVDGKPRSLKVNGQQLFYDVRGDVVLTELREVPPSEQQIHEEPLRYCEVVTVDGLMPPVPNDFPPSRRDI